MTARGHKIPGLGARTAGYVLGVVLLWTLSWADPGNGAVADNALADIQRVSQRLQDASRHAEQIRLRLLELAAAPATEIRQAVRGGLRGYADGCRVPAVLHDLELIREIHGLVDLLDEKIQWLNIGSQELAHYARLLQDDALAVRTIGAVSTGTLVRNIDKALAAYGAAVDGPLMDAAGLRLEDPETTWDRVLRNHDPVPVH